MKAASFLFAIAVLALLAPAAAAGEREDEVGRLKDELQAVVRKAEDLERAGRLDEARPLREKAEAIEARIRAVREDAADRPRGDEEMKRILGELEQGMKALRALGRREEAGRLERVAREVREDLERRAREPGPGGPEREAMARHLEVFRLAVKALRERERPHEAERLGQAIHALELALSGRQDEEARAAMERAPKPPETLEILLLAERIWRELGQPESADRIEKLVREARRAHPELGAERGERDVAKRHLEVLRVARKAFQEAGAGDAADRIGLAVHATELRLAGRDDEEARRIFETAPRREEIAKLLQRAAELWTKFGDERNAGLAAGLAKELDADRPKGNARGPAEEQMEKLQRRLAEMQKAMEELHREMEALRRELR